MRIRETLLFAVVLFMPVLQGQNVPLQDWKQWSPRSELKPEMTMSTGETGTMLKIAARQYGSYGKWISVVPGIKEGQAYQFAVRYDARNVQSTTTSVVAILSWCKDAACADPVQRDYAEPGVKGGRTVMSKLLVAPAPATALRIELGLKWTDAGSVEWNRPELTAVPAPKPRIVRLTTTHLKPPSGATVAGNLNLMLDAVTRAAEDRPDLIVFSENFLDRGVARPLDETAQTIPGPATEALGRKAREYKTYIATSLHEREKGLFYNTAVLIDRSGAVVGKYRKVHLTMIEADMGLTAGRDYPVFETDFGRVGLLTCWDNWFTETARILALKGAEVLVLPIAGDGVPGHWDVISRARAMDNGVFLVSSNTVGESSSRIVTPAGQVLAETTGQFGIASAQIDLAAANRVPWLSVGPGLGDARDLYMSERRPETYGALAGGKQ